MVSPDKLGFDLRERLPLPHNILARMELAAHPDVGQPAGTRTAEVVKHRTHNPKDEACYLDYHASAGDTAKRGIGRLATSTYVVAFEYIHTNVGELSQDAKANRPPRPDSGVGAIIVVGGWESQPHGEGWQLGGKSNAN
jgi:hypothetical protein